MDIKVQIVKLYLKDGDVRSALMDPNITSHHFWPCFPGLMLGLADSVTGSNSHAIRLFSRILTQISGLAGLVG